MHLVCVAPGHDGGATCEFNATPILQNGGDWQGDVYGVRLMFPADGKHTRSAVIHAKFMVETRLFTTPSSKKKISTYYFLLQPCTGIQSTCHGGRYHDYQPCWVFVPRWPGHVST